MSRMKDVIDTQAKAMPLVLSNAGLIQIYFN